MTGLDWNALLAVLGGDHAGACTFAALGETIRLTRHADQVSAHVVDRSEPQPCDVILEGDGTHVIGIDGLPGLDRDRALWVGYVDGAQLLSISTRHLGGSRDVFAKPGRHGQFLVNVGLPLCAEGDVYDDPVSALDAGPCVFDAAPVGTTETVETFTGPARIQAYEQGSLDWARGGPFRVASRTPCGRWQAQDLTYGFARIFSQPQHRARLGAPMGAERHCPTHEDPVHGYAGSYQLFSEAILHWDALTNRVWYQSWDGFVRMK